MPFWKDYVEAKPEVDDDDLPLPEHRIFDDEGYIKEKVIQAAAAALRTSPSRATNAKKSPALSPKRRAELLKSVGAKPTTPLRLSEGEAEAVAETHTPARSPSARKSGARSPAARKSGARSPAARARSPAATPKSPSASRGNSPARKASPKKASPKKASPKRASPKKASPKKAPAKKTSPKQSSASRSPARTRTRSPSPAKPKPSPKAGGRAKRSKSKSKSKSGSRKPARSLTPSPKWTLAALKDFAREKAIAIDGATTKAGILGAIKNSS